ncbi:MAG TPA: M20 family metallopeptidase [Vicinamibacterales bacterium]|jgi:glutamate carboxypeptidase
MLPLLSFCTAEQPWLLDTIEALARLESPTTEKTAVDRCGAELAARLRAIGAAVTLLPRERAGDLVRAEITPQAPSAAPILILGHFDTVWPVGQLARMPCEVHDGRLSGPGVFDMKAGIALAMLAVRALQMLVPDRRRPIVMLWTTDEEVGSASSREVLEDEARQSAAVLVLEPSLPGGAVKTARKGCGHFEVAVTGVAAHAGLEPLRGASAVAELAHQILRINAFQDLERGVHVNVVRANGGLQSNVIPEHAHALVDVRVPTSQAWGELAASFAELKPIDFRTSLDCRGVLNRPPLERTPAVVELFETARAVAGDLGLTLGEGETGGGSDGNFTAALGVPTLDGLGAVGAGAHALDEHVLVDALAPRAALIAGLLARLDALALRRQD